jgi:hypothetical protein
VSFADSDHGAQNLVPGFRLHHHVVGEHAAVPTDVPNLLGEVAFLVAQPKAGMMRDPQFAVGVLLIGFSSFILFFYGSF